MCDMHSQLKAPTFKKKITYVLFQLHNSFMKLIPQTVVLFYLTKAWANTPTMSTFRYTGRLLHHVQHTKKTTTLSSDITEEQVTNWGENVLH